MTPRLGLFTFCAVRGLAHGAVSDHTANMDSLQAINSKLTLQSAAVQIEKILKIAQKPKPTTRTVTEGEIDLLKQLCKSNNVRVCQLANEAILQLTTEGCVELGQMLGMLMTLLPNTNPGQFIVFSGTIFELLLIDLRRRCLTTPGKQNYVCQFDLKPPQHPVILLIDKASVESTGTILHLIVNTLNHQDDAIRTNSIEFLRPVLLHLFVNLCLYANCQPIWKLLVERSLHDANAKSIVLEILAWCRDTSATQTCFTVALLTDALEIVLHENPSDVKLQLEFALYLAAVLKNYVERNYDPSRCFGLLQAVCNAAMKCDPPPSPSLDVLLAIAVDLLLIVSPLKLFALLEIIQTILPACGRVSCMLTKEAMIQLLGQPSYTTKHLPVCDKILTKIEEDLTLVEWKEISNLECITTGTMYFHANLAKWTILCNWWNSYRTAIDDYLRTGGPASMRFTHKLSQLHRSIFLSSSYEDNVWKINFAHLVRLMKHSEVRVAQSMVPLLYGLAQHRDARRRLHVLQTIASMGAKENLIGILKALTKDLDRALCLDLYLRLWKAEPRTYPLLYDLLKDTSRRPNEDRWEHTVARAYTIREVCLINPTQHGEDLVNLFSEVLSNPSNSDNEVAICLSLDAISSLCENQVVNIVSTWKVLGFRFANERRPKVIKSLCRFFANVPLIKVTSPEQERLVNHIIGTLWQYVTDYEEREIIEAALGTLKHFQPDTLTLRQLPELFRQGIELPDQNAEGNSEADGPGSIPPECWIQLLQYTNHSAIEAVGDLLGHYIAHEIKSYRGGIYQTPPGRPEPSNLKYLPRASILSTIVNYLILQSTKFTNSDTTAELVLVQMLRIIAKPYPKPIPPLNWCFLHEYFHHCFEMRDACLQIAIKQMPFSGTAKRLVENYLNELCETVMLEEDLLKIYSSIADITEAVQTEIYKRFVHLSLQYLAERAEDRQFADDTPFIKTMALIAGALQREKQYENEDNYHLLCTTLENFFMRFDLGSEVFKKYIEALVHLPERHFTELLKPSTWTGGVSVEKLEKTIYLQFAFHQHNPTAEALQFVGLADIIATVANHPPADDGTLRAFFLQEWASFVELFARTDRDDSESDGKALVGFIAELIGLIQCKLTATDDRIELGALFMLDTLMTGVISFSGYGGLYGAKLLANERSLRLVQFPLALVTVFERNAWREIEIKMYEFLYHLYGIASLPNEYAECLRSALICCKKQPYFQQPKTLPKFVSLRRRL
ncbi:focadhesin-like [Anopheles stephensi]|uniref:focadhesin-like n=1 Tax=Anopheles stephensi TaxID=30069 RepID=UPI0007D412AE|nr:focadhesin-like [Anopheles stephensi]